MMGDVLADIGAELRERRESLGITQRDMAETLGTSQMQIWRVENGSQQRVSLKVIMAHAAVLGLETYVTFEEKNHG